MTKEEKEKRKLEKQKIKEEKKAQKLARREERRIAKLKKKGLYIEPEPPKEEPQEEEVVEEVQEQVEETPQEEPEKEEESAPEPVEETEEKQVQKKRKAPKQYHISLRVDNKWQLKFGGSSKALKLFDTQKEAIEYAKPLAAKQKAALVIHRTDGKIRKQDYTKK